MTFSDKERDIWFLEANKKGSRFIVVGNDRYFHEDSFYAVFVNNTAEVFKEAQKADGPGGSCETIYIFVDGRWEDFFIYSLQWTTLELWQLKEKLSDPLNGIFRYKKNVGL